MQWFHSKRKLKNVVLTKKYQMRYYGWWFILAFLLTTLLCFTIFLLFENHWQEIIRNDTSQIPLYALARSRYLAKLMLCALFVVMGLMAFAIMTAHRVAGPFIALHKTFEEIKNGNLSHRLRFRKEDELAELERTFNEMMDQLSPGNSGSDKPHP